MRTGFVWFGLCAASLACQFDSTGKGVDSSGEDVGSLDDGSETSGADDGDGTADGADDAGTMSGSGSGASTSSGSGDSGGSASSGSSSSSSSSSGSSSSGSSSSSSSSSSSGSSSSSTGGGGPGFYGDCATMFDCEQGEVCLAVAGPAGFQSVCATQCTSASMCPEAPGGASATPDCVYVGVTGDQVCILTCSSMADCPGGMLCAGGGPAGTFCLWP